MLEDTNSLDAATIGMALLLQTLFNMIVQSLSYEFAHWNVFYLDLNFVWNFVVEGEGIWSSTRL